MGEQPINSAHVNALVLDATPLITHPYTHYQNYAKYFYTTPTVFAEIKDANARKNLEIWKSLGTLNLVHPKQTSIDRVSQFARLTGDYSVLSANDIHILALTYELEIENNKGDWRLRKKPGDSLDHLIKTKKPVAENEASITTNDKVVEEKEQKVTTSDKTIQKTEESTTETGEKKKKKTRRGGKKQREKREAAAAAAALEESEFQEVNSKKVTKDDELDAEYEEEDDDGEWISPENLAQTMIKDSGLDSTGENGVETDINKIQKSLSLPENQVALATGDFAVQNVALQMNLNLMNFMSGLRIKRVRNYMLRCHACFKMFPLPKDGKAQHFCPSCGGQGTLLRCAVSIDVKTGKITPHLKKNFQWINRGNRFSIASPLSKNAVKRYGQKGYSHRKPQNEDEIYREDQKEYEKMIKQDEWTKRHNEKVLDNWIGGGSADNYMSPFAITGLKQHSVRVGRGRHVNSSRKKR